MTQTTVWLNTHFNCIPLIRESDVENEFRIIASYPSRKYTDVLFADLFELEPKLSDEQYVRFALEFVRRHGVGIFLPGRRINQIARRLAEFEALGCKVILAADSQTLEILDNKGDFYDALKPGPVVLPGHMVVSTSSDFRVAISLMQARHKIVCFKPTVGIFGFGFKIIETAENAEDLRNVDRSLIVNRSEALAFVSKQGVFTQQMLLEYLPGIERSVDCLAFQGRLVHCVVRRKLDDGSRILERNPLIEEQTARLVEHFKLDGLFNVQFKDKNWKPFILEINARMSGGIAMSCLSGMNFPYWALKLAQNPACAADIPAATTADIPANTSGDLRVVEVMKAVVLP